MELFGNCNFRDSIKFVVLLNFFSYMYLIWNPLNDMCSRRNAVEMKFKLGRNFNISFNRLLAKHELKNDLYKTNIRQNYADYGMNKNIKNEAQQKSTYSQVKGDSLNKLDAYKQGYKRRYSKKKGLSKFECYCEMKVFDKIDYIYGLAGNMKNNKKSYKKKIYDKFGIRLIMLVLSPLLGLIMPILFFDKDNALIKICASEHDHKESGTGDCSKYIRSSITSNDFKIISDVHNVFFLLLLIIVLSIIFYTLIKIVKYERLKSGKGKMKINGYYRFCKEFL